ncbi:MAG: hypothetical protein ACTHMV_16165 [Chitinophagaceae bacterium]
MEDITALLQQDEAQTAPDISGIEQHWQSMHSLLKQAGVGESATGQILSSSVVYTTLLGILLTCVVISVVRNPSLPLSPTPVAPVQSNPMIIPRDTTDRIQIADTGNLKKDHTQPKKLNNPGRDTIINIIPKRIRRKAKDSVIAPSQIKPDNGGQRRSRQRN